MIAHEPSSSEVQQNASSGTKVPPRPGSVVWVVMGGRLIKAAPEHLRMASNLETAEYHFKNPAKPPTDDLRKVLESAVGKQFEEFEDVHSQEPPPMDADPFDRDMNSGPTGQLPGGRPSASGSSSSSEAPLPGVPVSYGPEAPFRLPAQSVGPQEPQEPTSQEELPPRKPPARQTTGTERPVPMENDDEDLTGSADNPTSGAAASSGSASSSRKAPLRTASVPTRRLRAKTDITSEASKNPRISKRE